MDDKEYGKIRNPNYVRQLKVFSGLKFGNISPTDIDGFLDFGNKKFIFFELKHGSSSLQYGQKLALERLCDACESTDRASCLIIARHDTAENEEIDVANAIVMRVRYQKKWSNWMGLNVTLKECIKRFRRNE